MLSMKPARQTDLSLLVLGILALLTTGCFRESHEWDHKVFIEASVNWRGNFSPPGADKEFLSVSGLLFTNTLKSTRYKNASKKINGQEYLGGLVTNDGIFENLSHLFECYVRPEIQDRQIDIFLKTHVMCELKVEDFDGKRLQVIEGKGVILKEPFILKPGFYHLKAVDLDTTASSALRSTSSPKN